MIPPHLGILTKGGLLRKPQPLCMLQYDVVLFSVIGYPFLPLKNAGILPLFIAGIITHAHRAIKRFLEISAESKRGDKQGWGRIEGALEEGNFLARGRLKLRPGQGICYHLHELRS